MRRAGIAVVSVFSVVLTHAAPAFAQSTGKEPAGGAAIGEAIGATAGALVATALVAYLIAGHRSGRLKVLLAVRDLGGAALGPARLGVRALDAARISLLTAVLGMYWDISLHIDNGRDAGPLANPAHYLILIGLYGVLVAGVMSMALAGTERPAKTAIHLGGDWWAPVGGLMMAACGAFALAGFPLDDMWHRLFGQDVTLWGPTHLMLIGGASLATLGGMVLVGEAITAIGRDPEREGSPFIYHVRRALPGGRLPRGALHLPGRVRLRRPAVPRRLPADPDHARGRHRPRDHAPIHRPWRRPPRGGRVPRDSRLPGDHGWWVLGPDDPALPALHSRGAARGGGIRPRRRPQPGGERRHCRRPHRDRRPGGRVGLVPRLDADPVERLAAARGGHRRPHHRGCRRRRGRVHRRIACRPQRRADQPRGRTAPCHGGPPGGAGLRARADRRDRLGASDVGERPRARAGDSARHRRRKGSEPFPQRSASTRATPSTTPSS